MTKIFAHRGWSGHYPENTWPAFSNLNQLHFDGVELDVQLSADSDLFVFHDDQLERLTKASGYLTDHYSKDLSLLKVSAAGKEAPILEFSEFIAWAEKNDALINVELKTHQGTSLNLVDRTLQALRQSSIQAERIIISSFDWSFVNASLMQAPEYQYAYLLDEGQVQDWPTLFENMVQKGIAFIHPHWSYLTPDWVDQAHQAGLLINTWTVNDKRKMQELLDFNLFGIITNYPERLQELMVANKG